MRVSTAVGVLFLACLIAIALNLGGPAAPQPRSSTTPQSAQVAEEAAAGLPAAGDAGWEEVGPLSRPAGAPSPDPVVVVRLTTGRAVEGRLIREDAEQLILAVPSGRVTLPRRLVESIERADGGAYALREARDYARSGRLVAAERCYLRALADPQLADVARAELQELRLKLRHSLEEARLREESVSAGEAPRTGGPLEDAPLHDVGVRAHPAGASDWPPPTLDWETDPQAAFARARAEGRPLLLYYGNTVCPHCRRLAREVWPDPRVRGAAEDVVCLALFRDPSEPWDWCVRLDLMPYPRTRLLDGWGRELQDADAGRRVEDVLRSLQQARAQATPPPAPGQAPAALRRLLPPTLRAALRDPFPMARTGAWRRLLVDGELSEGQLVELYRWAEEGDPDPVIRRAVLQRAAAGGLGVEARRLLVEGLEDPNSWVRRAALAAIEARGLREALPRLHALLHQLTSDFAANRRSSVVHATNVHGDLVHALRALRDPSSVPCLEEVLALRACALGSTQGALQALERIWEDDPDARASRVLAALGQALAPPDERYDQHLVRAHWLRVLALVERITGERFLPQDVSSWEQVRAQVERARRRVAR